MKNHSKFACL